MLIGLGTDLVAVPALAAQLADSASHFSAATFTAGELAYSRGTPAHDPARHLAARFAAKEATLKALDAACAIAGVQPGVVPMVEIEVVIDSRGRPSLRLHGRASTLAAELGADRVWVSLTHDGDYAQAVVALERFQ